MTKNQDPHVKLNKRVRLRRNPWASSDNAVQSPAGRLRIDHRQTVREIEPDNERPVRLRRDPWISQNRRFLVPSGRWRYDPEKSVKESSYTEQVDLTRSEPSLCIVNNPAFYVLVVLSTHNGVLTRHEQELLGAARMLADDSNGAVIAFGHMAASDLGKAGSDRVVQVPAGWDFSLNPEIKAGFIQEVVKDYPVKHVLWPDDSEGRDLCLRVAAALEEKPAIGVHDLSVKHCVRRAFGEAKDIKQQIPKLLTLQSGIAATMVGIRCEARKLLSEPILLDSRIEVLGLVSQNSSEVPLEEAPFIMAAGNGISNWNGFNEVSKRLRATRAATRVVCDAGHMERDRQVGVSGHLVQADCYLALGISGAIQHLQGIEKCARVIAINSDAFAPIVKRADLAIIGDANAILDALLVMLEDRS